MAGGVSLATAYYELVPSMGGSQGAITKEMTGVGGSASKGFGKSFVAGTAKMMGPLAALFAGAKVGQFLGDAIGEAREAQKVGALTEQIIKSTGGTANVSAKQVGNLATAISNKSGMDDEAIQSGANMLLTFKNVRNEAGKGANVFDRATQAATDLSAAGFGDMAGQSKMLGKALNDPIKGISALGRSGVTFSEGQKKTIKGMVEQGDLLGAQKIILKEVESQVGGAAAASATAGEKLAVSWGNFKETIGTALLPVLDRVMNFISGKVLPGILSLSTKMGPVVSAIKGFFTGLSSGASEGGGKFAVFMTTIRTILASLRSIFVSTVSIITSLWAAFGPTIMKNVVPYMTGLLSIVRGAFTILRGIFKTVAALLKGDWKGAWDGIKMILSGAWSVIKGIVKAGFAVIKALFGAAKVVLRAAANAIWAGVKAAFSAGVSAAVGLVKGLKGKAVGALKGAGSWLLGVGEDIMRGLAAGIDRGLKWVTDKLNSLKDKITGPIKKVLGIASPSKVMRDEVGQWIPAGIAEGIDQNAAVIQRSVTAAVGDLSTPMAPLADGPFGGIGAHGRGSASESLTRGDLGYFARQVAIEARNLSVRAVDDREYMNSGALRYPSPVAGVRP